MNLRTRQGRSVLPVHLLQGRDPSGAAECGASVPDPVLRSIALRSEPRAATAGCLDSPRTSEDTPEAGL
jgi:hypothetical protein